MKKVIMNLFKIKDVILKRLNVIVNKVPIVVVLGITFLIISLPLMSNNLPYLDDSYLIKNHYDKGFWGPADSFFRIWGYYRFIYTRLLSVVFSLHDHLWIIRTIGISLHLVTSLLLFMFIKKIFKQNVVALFAFVMFLFYQYSYEAIAWPSNVGQYPLAPALCFGGAVIAGYYGIKRYIALICGGLIMGFSFMIHEQMGPLVILLMIFIAFMLPLRRKWIYVLIVMIPIIINALLIFITRKQNIRLSGEFAAQPKYIISNLYYIGNIIRTTPLGDLFYNTDGCRFSVITLLAIVVAILCISQLIITNDRNDAKSSNDNKMTLIMFILSVGAYLTSIVPIILSPVPWLTARVVYIPYLILTISFSLIIVMIINTRYKKAFLYLVTVLIGMMIIFQSHILSGEAFWYDRQIKTNHQRCYELTKLIVPSKDLNETSLLVVRGFPGTDTPRPQFGEHIIGMTGGEFRVMLGLSVYEAPKIPRFSFFSGYDLLCVDGNNNVVIDDIAWDAIYKNDDIRSISYLIWGKGKWNIQRKDGAKLEKDVIPVKLKITKNQKLIDLSVGQ